MRTTLARLVAFIAAVHLLGGHWLVLQTVAWSGMLVSYTQQDGFAEAVGKTFDGSSPCTLCQKVAEGQEKEKDHPSIESNHKLDAVLMKPALLPRRSAAPFLCLSSPGTLVSTLPQAPACPPPDAA